MKQNAETEIDLLLRRHARRGGGAARVFDDGGGAQDDASRRAGGGAHLDADELNAFAEGMLPAPARARYASHLADCDSCRKVVTELALVNSAAMEEEERVAVAPVSSPKSSWREWIAALFSPPVLRFAVPAFGLLIVGFILFAVMQTRRNNSTLVAQNGEKQATVSNANTSAVPQDYKAADSSTAAQPNASRESTAQDQKVIVPGEQGGVTVPPVQKPLVTPDAKNPEQARTETVPAEPTTVDKVTGGKRDEDRRQDEEAQRNEPLRERGRARDEERAAASIAPPSPASSAGAVSMAKEKSEVAKEAPKDQPARPSSNVILDGASADSNEINSSQNKGYGGAKTPNATLSARKRAAAPRNNTAETKTGEDDARNDAYETRRVGGRTFRRQGGAWIDTAYNSSRRIIPVRRGTEQYRALVADEPSIGSISSQLDGAVIIVWKDRAYRIDGGAAAGERTERKRN